MHIAGGIRLICNVWILTGLILRQQLACAGFSAWHQPQPINSIGPEYIELELFAISVFMTAISR